MIRPELRCALGLLCAFALLLCSCGDRERRVRFVTTTSTHNSGLIEYLLAEFTPQTGIEVDVLAVGTGKALAQGRRGDTDLLLVHARELEDAFLAEGHAIERRDVMWNEFVIVGPPQDPAGIRGMQDPAAALAKIAKAGVRFASRGDRSGTHVRELSLWKASGADRYANEAYVEAGLGMGASLIYADEKRAYLLADRGTYLSHSKRLNLELDVLVEGHASLRNPYGALLVNPTRHPGGQPDEARKLLDWLTSPAGQARIAAFQVDGKALFHPNAAK